jgi:mRNA-degrading endonuclease RelE of RelBE toxin-antitoxin system
MSYKVIPTPLFEKELKRLAKKYNSLRKDFSALVEELLIHPESGIPLGQNCFKIRLGISSKGKGKSGGARVITYVQIQDQDIFLLAIYDKSETATISQKELEVRLKALLK